MAIMRPRYKVGDKFKLSHEALDNYGDKFAEKAFTVRAVYTHHVPVAQMGSDPTGHPGFDPAGGSPLYGSELNFDVYEWEMEAA